MVEASARTVHVVDGDGWRILSSEVPKSLPVWVPVPDLLVIPGLAGGYAIPGFTSRVAALAAGRDEPRRTDLRRLRKEGGRDGIAINPGTPWEGGISRPMLQWPVAFRLLPPRTAGNRPQRLLELFPDASLFDMIAGDLAARLLRMPPGADLIAAAQRILLDIGELPFAPIVLVDSAHEPASVDRALAAAARDIA